MQQSKFKDVNYEKLIRFLKKYFLNVVFRMYKLVKLKNENHSESLIILLQSQIRGYLQRRSLVCNSVNGKQNNPENKASAALMIQRHWRSYKSRKLYKDLLNEQSAKNVQFKFFCQQVIKIEFIPFYSKKDKLAGI